MFYLTKGYTIKNCLEIDYFQFIEDKDSNGCDTHINVIIIYDRHLTKGIENPRDNRALIDYTCYVSLNLS